jgi:hypothetical protein
MPGEILYVYARIYQFCLLTLSSRLNFEPQRCVLKIYVIFQMAGRARRGQNERVPPPPPPPPTLQELMAQQSEILRQLAQRQPPPQHYGGGDHQRHPAAATYQEFLSTQPPLFTRAEDPLDADVWLRVVESKFPLLHGVCSEVTQGLGGTIFLLCSQMTERWNGESSRQLSGGIIYQHTLWTESSTSFWHSLRETGQCYSMLRPLMTCASMLGIMQTRTRRRGTGSDRRGLSTKLRDHLNTVRANSYNELVNMAISQEDCITARQAEKKRKTPMAGHSAQPQRFRIVSDTQNRGPQQQQGRWVIRPQQQQAPNRTQFPAQRNI